MHKPNPTFNIFYQFDCIQQPPSQGQKAKDHQRRRPTNSCHVLNSLAQRRHLTPVIGLQPIKTINVLHFGCQRITFHVAFVVDLDLALVIVFIEDGCFQHCLMIDAFRCHLALKNLGIVSLFASEPFKARGVWFGRSTQDSGDYMYYVRTCPPP